jgi:hypothetical protein
VLLKSSVRLMSDEGRRRAGEGPNTPDDLTRYFVSTSSGGGWAVFREGEPRALHLLPRRAMALETARTMARMNAPSQVLVEQEEGGFQLQYDFPAGAF